MDMMFAAVMALKAYSNRIRQSADAKVSKSGEHIWAAVLRFMFRQQDGGATAVVGCRRSSRGDYSIPTWYNLPCSEKIVMCRSYAEPPKGGGCQSVACRVRELRVAPPVHCPVHTRHLDCFEAAVVFFCREAILKSRKLDVRVVTWGCRATMLAGRRKADVELDGAGPVSTRLQELAWRAHLSSKGPTLLL